MIDDQQLIQIGLIPLDNKCHLSQQLHQQLQQQKKPRHQPQTHHQQHQLHQQQTLLIAGNERMLTTTPTTAIATAAHSSASTMATATTPSSPPPQLPPQPPPQPSSLSTASLAPNETMNMARNGNPTATTTVTKTTRITTKAIATPTLSRTLMSQVAEAAATGDETFSAGAIDGVAYCAAAQDTMMATSPAANVNGSCNNHNSDNNNRKTYNGSQQHQAAIHSCGPDPPVLQQQQQHTQCSNSNNISNNATNAQTSVSARVTLAECSLNGMNAGIFGATAAAGSEAVAAGGVSSNIALLCANNGINNNNGLILQHQLHHHQQHHHNHHPLQLQQQQHHQLQNQHAHSHHPSQLHHSHPHLHHPAAIVANATGLTGGLINASLSMSLSLSLSCGDGNDDSSSGGGGGGGSLLPLSLTHCGYCCQPIYDRYIMRVADMSFHERCLKCFTCSLHLVQSCYARDGKLYCRLDYERLFIRNRCLGCGHKIASDELVMRTLENVFHLKCFACVVCGAVLKKGEQYVVKQGQLFCRFDYEKEVEMLQGYDFYGDDLFPPKLDGRRGPKRPRTILNTQQRRAFKASFEVSPKPCRKVRENLAKETGLSLRIVQVWFQNQRAKVKKIQKKAKQEHSTKGASDSQDSQESDSSSLAKIKDEAHSDSESRLESPFSACGAGGSIASAATAAGADGVAIGGSVTKLRCIKDENENVPFNCMETNKENCNKTNEPILNTILGLSYATFQQLMGPFAQTPMINPIDRLYSMQNSYFRPDEISYGNCAKDAGDN